MDARIADALARLPDYFGNHVLVSVTALLLGLAMICFLAASTVGAGLVLSILLTDRKG